MLLFCCSFSTERFSLNVHIMCIIMWTCTKATASSSMNSDFGMLTSENDIIQRCFFMIIDKNPKMYASIVLIMPLFCYHSQGKDCRLSAAFAHFLQTVYKFYLEIKHNLKIVDLYYFEHFFIVISQKKSSRKIPILFLSW